jgi:site-specific recombinase XerD
MNNPAISPASAYFLTINKSSTMNSSFYRLRNFCRFTFGHEDFDLCEWEYFSYIKILEFMQSQREQIAPSSINITLSVLKGVALQAWQLGFINVEEYMRIKTLKKLKSSRVDSGRSLSLDEINHLKRRYSLSSTKTDRRNFAIFAIGVGTGLRRSEISNLNIEQFNSDRITIKGKGDKERVIYLTAFVRKAIERWLKVRRAKKGALFVRVSASDGLGSRLLLQGVHSSIKKIQVDSGLAHFTSHDLRRTFATVLLDVGADKFAVQRLLGHSSLNTTERYDKRGDRAAKAAIELLPF